MYLGPWLVTRGVFIGIIILVIFSSIVTTGLTTTTTSLASADVDQSQPPSGQAANIDLSGESIAGAGDCQVSNKYPEGILQWCDLISIYSEQFELSPDLIAALIWQESGGKPGAYSKSGAVGLMQVMPRDGLAASFMCKNGPCFAKRPTIEELQDPEFNIKYGTRMLARLVNERGNLRDALKSYGPKDVGYYYADKVLGIYDKYGG
jgi:soluble lytic murein transglycosylase-like protein